MEIDLELTSGIGIDDSGHRYSIDDLQVIRISGIGRS